MYQLVVCQADHHLVMQPGAEKVEAKGSQLYFFLFIKTTDFIPNSRLKMASLGF